METIIIPQEIQIEENQNNNSTEYRLAECAALHADCVQTANEFQLYANAIYRALMWGKGKQLTVDNGQLTIGLR